MLGGTAALNCAGASWAIVFDWTVAAQVLGGRKLRGEVEISGSKNAALVLMAAALLCKAPVVSRHQALLLPTAFVGHSSFTRGAS